ncbi:MAG: hypothetical protein JWO36_6637 [Myxococcales bacterium]|nr:hypothetical protein [Myxococcales bacterium]
MHEFHTWLRVAELSPVTAKLDEETRVKKAAQCAFDRFVEFFPEETKKQLMTARDKMIATLIESVADVREFN